MAKAFKKTGTKVESIPTATTVEKVGDTEYGVADYQGRKTYFEKDDNGAYTIPSQDSELNPHFFPGYDKKSGSIDNSNATTKRDILTGRELRQVGKAFKAEQQFNKSLAKEGQYNIGDKEMLGADQDPNNPMNASVKTMAFTRDLSPKDAKDIKRIGRIVGGDVVFNQEETDQNITNMMRANNWNYEQAYESEYGTKPTGATPEKFAAIETQRATNRENERINALTSPMTVKDPNDPTGQKTMQIPGMSADAATKQVQGEKDVVNAITGKSELVSTTPGNETVLPAGAAFGMVNGQRQLIMPSETPYNPALNRKAWAKMDTTMEAQEKWGGNPPLTFEAQRQYYRPNTETPASQPIITNPVFPATPNQELGSTTVNPFQQGSINAVGQVLSPTIEQQVAADLNIGATGNEIGSSIPSTPYGEAYQNEVNRLSRLIPGYSESGITPPDYAQTEAEVRARLQQSGGVNGGLNSPEYKNTVEGMARQIGNEYIGGIKDIMAGPDYSNWFTEEKFGTNATEAQKKFNETKDPNYLYPEFLIQEQAVQQLDKDIANAPAVNNMYSPEAYMNREMLGIKHPIAADQDIDDWLAERKRAREAGETRNKPAEEETITPETPVTPGQIRGLDNYTPSQQAKIKQRSAELYRTTKDPYWLFADLVWSKIQVEEWDRELGLK